MRMTAASEYGCLAMLAIAESGGEWCKTQEILERFEIPPAFLQQILRKLTGAGLLLSRRGAEGGFRLAREASDITIAEIVRLFDGPLAPVRSASDYFYEPTPLEASRALSKLMRDVRNAVAAILESQTLADMVAAERRLRKAKARSGHR